MAQKNANSLVIQRYAQAFLNQADKAGKKTAIFKNLDLVLELVAQSSDFKQLVYTPLISREKKISAVQAVSKQFKFEPVVANLLSLLAQNRRLSLLVELVHAIYAAESAARGEVAVQVDVADKITKAQEKALATSIANSIGKAVSLTVVTKPELIGGMVITIGSKMIDDSVKRKLERLEIALRGDGQANQNLENLEHIA